MSQMNGRPAETPTEEIRAALTPAQAAPLDGRLILPGDSDYDTARTVYFTGVDRRPAAILRAGSAADVARGVRAAREVGVELAVRSGGHSLAALGVCEGGLVLDLSEMRALAIDPVGRTAWAEPGVTAGEYTTAAGAQGLATGFGDAPTVCVGGITLGGGVGFLHRKLGLTLDSLLGAEVVTADGAIVRASSTENPDLFWAIRGGGGNFGVVTRLHFQLHAVDEVLGGFLIFPATPERIAALVEAVDGAEDDLTGMLMVMLAPPMPMIPPEHYGAPVVAMVFVHAGSAEGGEAFAGRVREIGTPLFEDVRAIRYPEVYSMMGEGPHPTALAVRTFFMDGFDAGAARTVLDLLPTSTAPMKAVHLRFLGGAVARVPADATAFAHRTRRLMVNVAAVYEGMEETSVHERWVAQLTAALPRGVPGAYIGFLGAEGGEEQVREAYPRAHWERLRAIKDRYDPTNLFRGNQNIPPGA